MARVGESEEIPETERTDMEHERRIAPTHLRRARRHQHDAKTLVGRGVCICYIEQIREKHTRAQKFSARKKKRQGQRLAMTTT
jgi:hypothetical protein